MTIQSSLKDRQNHVNIFYNNAKTKCLIYSKIIIEMIKFINTAIYLIWAQKIYIVDPKCILYTKEQVEGKVTKIRQINCII